MHNTLCTMYITQYTSAQCAGPDHTVNVQHVLSGAPVCNMLSDALLFLLCTLDNTQCNMQYALCSALLALLCNRSHGCLHCLCTLDNYQYNMQHCLWSALHIAHYATCNMLSDALLCRHCSATDHTDVCTPVSGADGVLRPSLLGRQRQRHCQCLNLHRNTSPQCHQTAPAQTLQ